MHCCDPIDVRWLTARPQRHAFTLLELMLVLAVVAMIGAIMVPRLDEVFERQKLRGAADSLRLEWDATRLEAMRSGQAQVFQCLPGTAEYTIQPLVLQSDIANAGQGATLMMNGGNLVEAQAGGFLTAADTSSGQSQQLKEGITFVSCAVTSDLRSFVLAQESQSMGSGAVNTQNANQSVIFYPDGSTSTAELRLQNERGDIRGLQIRGLTGHSRTVDVQWVPSTPHEKAG